MNPTDPANEQGLLPDPPPGETRHDESATAAAPAPRRRGFATMDREKVREIARHGGKAAHAAGTAHEFTSDEARAAGRKGGLATHAKRRSKVAEDSTQRQ